MKPPWLLRERPLRGLVTLQADRALERLAKAAGVSTAHVVDVLVRAIPEEELAERMREQVAVDLEMYLTWSQSELT